MQEKGVTPILFILIILIISAGIFGGSFYIKQSNFLNKQPQSSLETIKIPQPTQLSSLAPSSIESVEQNQTPAPTRSNNEVKLTGAITDVNNGCWVDGVCSIKIDNSWIEVEIGGLRPANMTQEPRGQLIGISLDRDSKKFIGQSAEFYGATKENGNLTIYGNSNYYLKLVK